MDTRIDRVKVYLEDPSTVEDTSCGIPNTRTLLVTGYGWDRDLHKYDLATKGRLTNEGKKLMRASNRDWVSELPDGSIAPHPDFDLALSVLDNQTAGIAEQLRVNKLCREIALCSLAAGNKQVGPGSEQANAMIEDAQTNLKTDYTLWSKHLTRIKRNSTHQPVISEAWSNQHQINTQALAQTVGRLSSLALDPHQLKTRQGGQSSHAPATTADHGNNSLPEQHVQSNSSAQTGRSGDRGLGGLFTPDGSARNTQYSNDEEEEPERGSGGSSRFTLKGLKGLFKRPK